MIALIEGKILGPDIDYLAIAPVLALAAAALVVILAKAILRKRGPVNQISLGVSIVGVVAAGVILGFQWNDVRDHGAITTIAGAVRVDTFGVFLGVVVIAAAAMALFLAASYLDREGLEAPEYYALMLLSAAGMLTMTTANDLIVVFLALELLSIPLYVLAAFDRRRLSSQESGIKYFVLGAFSSAVFLYGVALTYGATGTTSLTGIADFLAKNTLFEQGTLLAGLAMLLVGVGFKVAAVPFHMWTPDVYQGAPTPVTAFMASATKAAGFAALLRVLGVAFPLYRTDWRPAIWVLAALSLIVGSVAAVVQTDVKRILAYSSIAHAGYILIGLQADNPRGRQAALIYLFVYAFMTVGAFAVITVATRKGDDHHSLDDYRGLALRRPVVGGLLAFFVLAQAGVPLTGGFVVKLQVFASAVDAGEYGLAVIGVLAAVIAAFFYLRIAVTLFNKPDGDEPAEAASEEDRPVDAWTGTVLAVTTAAVLFAGILPGAWLTFAKDATFLL
ncbi:MAG: NADH-quinone oxidoreductase subunit N [Acidimicrobiia bacterium]